MVAVKWKNAHCSDASLQVMQDCCTRVEEKILQHQNARKAEAPGNAAAAVSAPFHVPTAINDELHAMRCIAISVSHNAGFGSSFRGMECSQMEVAGHNYNIGIIRR